MVCVVIYSYLAILTVEQGAEDLWLVWTVSLAPAEHREYMALLRAPPVLHWDGLLGDVHTFGVEPSASTAAAVRTANHDLSCVFIYQKEQV